MAESGVMISTPLVCMSIVASAFQYGWAPTLMPVTTTLISPPAWVNSTIPRSAREIQSMVSVPESIAIFAPAEMANHSTGACSRRASSMAARIRRHSGSASAPSARVGSPSSTTRRIPSGYRFVGVLTTPSTRFATFEPGARSTGTGAPPSSRSYSVNSPSAPPGSGERVISGMSSYGYTAPRRRARITFCVYAFSSRSGPGGRSVTRSVSPAPG